MRLLLVLFSLPAFPLERDAKFLARILGVSDSKKTILINKGREIKLKEGDHAKISLPTGLVARAVLVKLSPTRSVWSIYRFLHKDKLLPDMAFTFKISHAVKLSPDESKDLGSLAQEKPEDKKQLRLKHKMATMNEVLDRIGPVDYSSLEDEKTPKKNLAIDWSGLDGEKDTEHFNNALDYSNLR